MIDLYGDSYKKYMMETGTFFPNVSKSGLSLPFQMQKVGGPVIHHT